MHIVDLHNDLLSFLTHENGRSPEDPHSRSSYGQLKAGNVALQTMAIYTVTGYTSVASGRLQVEQYVKLVTEYQTLFAKCSLPLNPKAPHVHLLPAFENASSFASESEPLEQALNRLEGYVSTIGPLFYISLTWDHENRFGGGNQSSAGLKDDGKHLLEWMSGKKIAIDLSHTSDRLAHDILDFIDKCALDVPVIASHSNFRAISNYPRNLPEELAREIVRRKGLIGLNFFAPFVHQTDPSALLRHVEYALDLGAGDALCFGADFFQESDFSVIQEKYQRKEAFYAELSDSSVYPSVLESFMRKLKMTPEQLEKIASQNALRFLKERIGFGTA